MKLFRHIVRRIRFSRQESIALIAVFGLYVLGLTWRHIQKTAVEFDPAFYARIDSVTGDRALLPASFSAPAVTDTLPKPKRQDHTDSLDQRTAFDSLETADGSPAEPVQMETGRLNINFATERQLTLLPGIGPALAGRIVSYRRQHGNFQTPAGLLNVKGIGPKTLAGFEGMIVVE